MGRNEKVAYVKKQIQQGFKSYYGLSSDELVSLDDEHLDVEYDCAINWTGDE
ncbi:hypothetical protein ABRP55_20335 [Pectobacterium zantedeschiae]|uniref:hypothetical protein n=1 Tax=Pectobacterium zantedeschiae TaxID=2034769 RepID=UPI0032EBFB75